MFEYPEKKVVELVIKTKYGSVSLMLQQATARETEEYLSLCNRMEESGFKDKVWRFKHYTKYRKDIVKKSIIKEGNVIKRKLRELLVMRNIHLYKEEIFLAIHKPRVSKYKDFETAKAKGQRTQMFSISKEMICEKTKIPLDEIYSRLTMEQIGRWFDRMTFEYYESFDEGKLVNARLKAKQGLTQKHKDLLAYMEK